MTEGGLVSILFTDVVASTEVLARAGDERAQRIFRAHHELLAQTASAHGGEEVKWLGDGLMVVFGSAADAVRCAVAMQESARRQVRGERLSIRIGINAGEIVRESEDYFGLPVVIARRLCDVADTGQIVCAEVIATLLTGRPDFVFRDLGNLDLKGVPRPVPAHVVLGTTDRSPFVPNRMPFVGRDRHLARLRKRWRETAAGRGGLVLVSGEPGIGKTRLVEELADEAAADGAEVLWGRCFEGEWTAPYAAFVEALEAAVMNADLSALRDELGISASPLARLLPGLRTRLSDLPEAAAVSPQEERFRILEGLARFMVARSERLPVLVCLDDLHWSDQGTIDALRHVARFAAHRRLLLVATYRDTETPGDHPLTQALGILRRETDYDRIRLDGLEAEAVSALLDALANRQPPEEAAPAITTETDGNPFFIREVLRHLEEEGRIGWQPGGRWTFRLPVDSLGIPEGIREVVARRIVRLSDAAKRLIGTACAFEGPFHLDVMTAASGLSDEEALDGIDELLAAQFLEPATAADHYLFTHALIRQTLYAGLSGSRQLRLHRRVAESLEAAAGPAPSPGTAGEIAAQYHRSRSLPGAERGVDAALAAAAHAEATGGQAEVARFLRIALDLLAEEDPRRPRLLGRLATALIWSSSLDEGVAIAIRAGARIAAAEGDAAAAAYLADAAWAIGSYLPQAWEIARHGLRYAGPVRDFTWARLTVIDFFRRDGADPENPGIPVDAPDRWEAARIMRASLTDPAGWGGLELPAASRAELAESGNHSVLVCWAGDFARVLPLATGEAERSLAQGQTIRTARCFTTMAFCQLSLGYLDEGRASVEEAERLTSTTGTPFGTRHARENLTAYLDDHDGLAGVVDSFTGLIPDLRSTQAFALGPTFAIVARTAARLGRVDDALAFLGRLVPWLEQAPAWTVHFSCMTGYAAETLWLLQRLDHAPVIEDAIRNKWLIADFRDIAVDARLSMARLRALAGQWDEASRWFAEARSVLTEQAARPLLAICDHDEALMHLRRGGSAGTPATEALVESAIRQFKAIGMIGWSRRADELALTL